MLSNNAKDQIRGFLTREGLRYIDDCANVPAADDSKPFHARLMPVPYQMWNRFSERSFSTRSGGWWPELALIVARDNHPHAQRGKTVTGTVRAASEAHITAVLEDMDRNHPRRTPSRELDISEVLGVQGPGGETRTTISDLFVLRADGTEMYFELKTPQPNKGQCRAMKQQILLIHALCFGRKVEAYAAAAYNPAGDGNEYDYQGNYVRQFLQPHQDMLVGREFWEVVGDLDTYDELLEICEEVGNRLDEVVRRIIEGRP